MTCLDLLCVDLLCVFMRDRMDLLLAGRHEQSAPLRGKIKGFAVTVLVYSHGDFFLKNTESVKSSPEHCSSPWCSVGLVVLWHNKLSCEVFLLQKSHETRNWLTSHDIIGGSPL